MEHRLYQNYLNSNLDVCSGLGTYVQGLGCTFESIGCTFKAWSKRWRSETYVLIWNEKPTAGYAGEGVVYR